MSIADTQLVRIMPRLKEAAAWAAALDPALDRFGITTAARQAAFLAQVAHESGEFARLSENLSCSATRLRQVWPKRFPTQARAEAYARQPEKLANYVYANRLGNGDTAGGDGWRYRGRGLIQTTGRSNYRDTGNALGLDLVELPDLLASDKGVAALAAAWFFKSRGCNALADEHPGDVESEDFKRITKLINGGLTGHAERVRYWRRARQVLGLD